MAGLLPGCTPCKESTAFNSLDNMLSKVADRYELEVDQTVDTTFKLIEPILLVVMAVAVGFIVFALFMPLLTMMQQMSKR